MSQRKDLYIIEKCVFENPERTAGVLYDEPIDGGEPIFIVYDRARAPDDPPYYDYYRHLGLAHFTTRKEAEDFISNAARGHPHD